MIHIDRIPPSTVPPLAVPVIRGYPFRCFKSIGLELDICQTKLLNHFFSFQLKV